jgi:hypothetical protein
MFIRLKLAAVIGLVLITISSCLMVAVETDSAKAEVHFRQARERIARLSSHSSDPATPHRLRILIYDPDEKQLVRISLPFWLAKKGLREAIEDSEYHRGKAPDYDFDIRAFSQAISRMPRGLLAEVWSEEEKILLWLE